MVGAGAALGHQGVSKETEKESWNTRPDKSLTTVETQVV